MKRKIALLYGGESAEHDVSINGSIYLKRLLEKTEHEILPIYINREGRWELKTDNASYEVFPCPSDGGALRLLSGECITIDAAIPLLHGRGGESGEIQGLLHTAGIPFVGADIMTGAVCLDKHYTKCIAQNHGIPVAKWVAFSEKNDTGAALELCKRQIGFPMFIKPRRLGSSVGAYPVHDDKEFYECFPKAMEAGENLVIVEELFEKKRELECAFYQVGGTVKISHPGEILTDGFYGYEEKYKKQTKTLKRAEITESVRKEIKEYNLLLSKVCSLRHLARIDYFLTKRGVIFNEINTFPGFTEQSLYPKLLLEAGIEPRDAILAFIEDVIGC